MTVFVLGRFPPPVDGQTLATERLASLLEADLPTVRANTEPASPSTGGVVNRAVHFLRVRPYLRDVLTRDPGGTVLWTAISPDVLGHFRDLVITLPALRPRQRVFAVVHRGNFRKLFESPATAATARRLVGRLNGFVFLTQYLADDCARWIPIEKRIVIPNTIDDELAFSDAEVSAKQQLRRERDVLRVLFVGNMIRSKGYLDALEAVGRLHRSSFSIEARFAGRWDSASDREEFEQRVAVNDLSSTVHHFGAVENRQAMKALYHDADVLLLPSYYRNEAQPLVILEALNAGTPVVSTEHAGIPEIVRNGSEGLLVPTRDPSALASAVREMDDTERWQRFSRAARRRFLDRYSPHEVQKMWRSVIDV